MTEQQNPMEKESIKYVIRDIDEKKVVNDEVYNTYNEAETAFEELVLDYDYFEIIEVKGWS